MMPQWRLGTMGFGYSQWAGTFYPKGMKAGDYLSWYAQQFDAVELDTTFHATPTASRVRHWASMVPVNFRFSAKAPRAVTHDAPLEKGVAPMMGFVDAMRECEGKLGVILLQFPPTFAANRFGALDDFLGKLPTDVRFAVEFRHPSWRVSKRTETMLRHHRVAWTAVDAVNEKAEVRATTDFLYVRWIGEHGRFTDLNHEQLDMSERLEWWKARLADAAGVHTIFGFFNNDYSGYSVVTCNRFKRMLGIPVSPAAGTGELFH